MSKKTLKITEFSVIEKQTFLTAANFVKLMVDGILFCLEERKKTWTDHSNEMKATAKLSQEIIASITQSQREEKGTCWLIWDTSFRIIWKALYDYPKSESKPSWIHSGDAMIMIWLCQIEEQIQLLTCDGSIDWWETKEMCKAIKELVDQFDGNSLEGIPQHLYIDLLPKTGDTSDG